MQRDSEEISRLDTLKNWLHENRNQIIKFLLTCIILVLAWIAFIRLVAKPYNIPAPSALIMVWASVIILFVGLFPKIVDRIKKIKLKDIEIELQETISTASSQISLPVLGLNNQDRPIFSEKGYLGDLGEILELASRSPSKEFLLVANLKSGNFISIKVLQVYLFFLDLIGISVTVLFIDTRRNIEKLSEITKGNLIGAISGKKVLQTFFYRMPELFRIYNFTQANTNISFVEIMKSRRFIDDQAKILYDTAYNMISDQIFQNTSTFLRKADVEKFFKGEISTYSVDASVYQNDIGKIRKPIIEGNEYILILKKNKLDTVLPICFLTKDITKKIFLHIPQQSN
jgi:hypothetical protein